MNINLRSFTDKEHKIVKAAFWFEAGLNIYSKMKNRINKEQSNIFFLRQFSSVEASEKL